MVLIPSPPPSQLIKLSPLHKNLRSGTNIIRLFDPLDNKTEPTTFRHFGPLHRFDHHRNPVLLPAIDDERGILYAAFTLSCCMVEVFGDARVITTGSKEVALLQLIRDVMLLDLRGSGSMRAGTVAALSKDADRPLTQSWAQYFYDNDTLYRVIDGLIYSNAHNDEDAIALFERATESLTTLPTDRMRLDDPSLRSQLQEIAMQNGLFFEP